MVLTNQGGYMGQARLRDVVLGPVTIALMAI